MKVNKQTMINDLLQMDQNIAGLLMGHGLHCIGCMLAANENIEQACMAHGLNVDLLLEDINAYLAEQESEEKD